LRTGRALGAGLGLVAGALALAAGGVAAGLELERRVVSKRIGDRSRVDDEPFFSLRSAGPTVLTPDGVRLHTEIDEVDPALGPDPVLGADPPTLVWVHGYALSLDCWHFQRAHFRGRVRQVLYDQRSHGRSTRSAAEHCRVPQLAEDLRQVLAELTDDQPVVLVGHSMGGMAIMHLATQYPELFGPQVKGVALMSTSAGELADFSPIRGIPGRAFSRMAPPLLAGLNRLPGLVERGRRTDSDLGYVVTRRMGFGSDVPASYVEFVSEMLAETSLEVVADFYPTFRELDEYQAFEVVGRVPCAVVCGEDDLITPIEHTDKILELVPHASALRVPDCGHLGMIEHHELFSGVVDALYASVAGGVGQDRAERGDQLEDDLEAREAGERPR
jgi:pimeloyl-ACP methyl ester carboxylesterase